mmetsp:Transcript_13709/g.51286  ORF Transcript_13709/g.51286 Transcript_13709/m.51286 type:complete len:201 (+) Transcript_13709:881-1483(+)
MFFPFARQRRSTPSNGQSPLCVLFFPDFSSPPELGSGYTTALNICFSSPWSTYVNRIRRAYWLLYTQLSTRGLPLFLPKFVQTSASIGTGTKGPNADSSLLKTQRMCAVQGTHAESKGRRSNSTLAGVGRSAMPSSFSNAEGVSLKEASMGDTRGGRGACRRGVRRDENETRPPVVDSSGRAAAVTPRASRRCIRTEATR